MVRTQSGRGSIETKASLHYKIQCRMNVMIPLYSIRNLCKLEETRQIYYCYVLVRWVSYRIVTMPSKSRTRRIPHPFPSNVKKKDKIRKEKKECMQKKKKKKAISVT